MTLAGAVLKVWPLSKKSAPAEAVAGQWIGLSKGGQADVVVVDFDDGPEKAVGTARVFFSDQSPGAICQLEIGRAARKEKFENIPLHWMPHNQPIVMTADHIRKQYPNIELPETAEITLERDGDKMAISWQTPIGTSGSAELIRRNMEDPSEIESRTLTWPEFKDFSLEKPAGKLIFRGQPGRYKLRTAFHRTYRKDLVKYTAEDIIIAHRQLTARTNHVFDLEKGSERGAFWNLLQHHGFPTPLLDWTYSPFVAAFFAYRRRKPATDKDEFVRILAFEKEEWVRDFSQLDAVNFAHPHFSVLEALAIENARAIPQQALSTLSNIDDIENYVLNKEKEKSKTYIYAIDLPAGIRPQVMAELSLMGITAGSLFPGIDGACEELMGRFFHHQVAPVQR